MPSQLIKNIERTVILFAAQLPKEHSYLISPWQRCKHCLDKHLNVKDQGSSYLLKKYLSPPLTASFSSLLLSYLCETFKEFSAKI